MFKKFQWLKGPCIGRQFKCGKWGNAEGPRDCAEGGREQRTNSGCWIKVTRFPGKKALLFFPDLTGTKISHKIESGAVFVVLVPFPHPKVVFSRKM